MFDYQRVVKVDLDGVSLSVPQKCWVWGDPRRHRTFASNDGGWTQSQFGFGPLKLK